jgi:hypothetical protein
MQNGKPNALLVLFADDAPLGSAVTRKSRIERYRANCSSIALEAVSAGVLFFALSFAGAFFAAFLTGTIPNS